MDARISGTAYQAFLVAPITVLGTAVRVGLTSIRDVNLTIAQSYLKERVSQLSPRPAKIDIVVSNLLQKGFAFTKSHFIFLESDGQLLVANKEETPTTVRGFSINNIMSFFKNGVSKIKDGIKKYDDERTEDLTDILINKGQLWNNIG